MAYNLLQKISCHNKYNIWNQFNSYCILFGIQVVALAKKCCCTPLKVDASGAHAIPVSFFLVVLTFVHASSILVNKVHTHSKNQV